MFTDALVKTSLTSLSTLVPREIIKPLNQTAKRRPRLNLMANQPQIARSLKKRWAGTAQRWMMTATLFMSTTKESHLRRTNRCTIATGTGTTLTCCSTMASSSLTTSMRTTTSECGLTVIWAILSYPRWSTLKESVSSSSLLIWKKTNFVRSSCLIWGLCWGRVSLKAKTTPSLRKRKRKFYSLDLRICTTSDTCLGFTRGFLTLSNCRMRSYLLSNKTSKCWRTLTLASRWEWLCYTGLRGKLLSGLRSTSAAWLKLFWKGVKPL